MPDDLAIQQQFFSLILEAEEGLATVSSYTAWICHCNTVSVNHWTPLFFPIVLNKWKLQLLCHRSIWFTEYLTASFSPSESVLRVVSCLYDRQIWLISVIHKKIFSTGKMSCLQRGTKAILVTAEAKTSVSNVSFFENQQNSHNTKWLIFIFTLAAEFCT